MPYVSTPFAFPFCISDKTSVWNTVGSAYNENNYTPFGLTYEEVFEWYWRIKSWLVTYTNGTSSSNTYTVVAGSESDIVCANYMDDFHEFPDEGNFLRWQFFTSDTGPSEQIILVSGEYHIEYLMREDGGVVTPNFGYTFTLISGTSFKAEQGGAVWNFQALEWWPYDPGDGGGPVWDTSTGSQLRDPFSIQSR